MTRPGKIVCVGRNYREHAKEMGNEVPKEPLIFFKPPSSVIGDGETIVLTPLSEQIEYEGEIGLVVGRSMRNVRGEQALRGIRGVVALNDVTARDLQRRDGQWTRAKGFDTFCPIGPEVQGFDGVETLSVITRVNGMERQRGHARDFVFDVATLLEYITRVMTLDPGDVIATGTPAGVGRLSPGDVVEVEIPGVSRVSNPVTAEP